MDEFVNAGITDDVINKVTWENACAFYDWDPFQHTRGSRRPSVRSVRSPPTSTRP